MPLKAALSPAPFTASAATRGEMIQVTSVADPGQTLNQSADLNAVSLPGWIDTGLDLIHISACNNDAAARDLHIQWSSGGAANRITTTLPVGAGLVAVVDGHRISRELPIYAWASAGSVVNILFRREPFLLRL